MIKGGIALINKLPKSILKADPANMELLDFSGKL